MITAFFSCPRKVNYLSDTLNSYFREFKEKPTIYEEPGHDLYEGHSKVNRHINEEHLGLVENWINAICFMRLIHDDWYMLCEDDLQFSRGCGIKIRNHLSILTQEIPIAVSPYCSMINQPEYQGWMKPRKQSNFCGSLCIIMNRKAIELVQPTYILMRSMAPYLSHVLDEEVITADKPTHLDHAIGATFSNLYIHNPTLIFHTGLISASGKEQPNYIRSRMPAI